MAVVLVVGAGPVGLTLALELARYRVPVRIVDKAVERNTKSKALAIWSRTLELLERAGCAADLVDAGNRVVAADISAGGQRIGRITFDGVTTPYPYAIVIPQSDTERILEEHLRSLGVSVERGVELTAFSADERTVVSTLRHPDGSDEHVETEWIAGCDGAHSFVRHNLQMEFAGSTLPSDFILADIHLSGVTSPVSEMAIMWHEDGLLALFPISGSRYRVIADAGLAEGAKPRPEPTLDDIQAIVDRRGPGGIRAYDPLWLASFRINERKVSDYRAGRAFLAGDAAHVHSPAGGQGMNTGMQDACNLAWKLALVCAGTCAAEPLLASYSAERSPIATELLVATGRVTAVGVVRNPVLQFVRNHVAQLVFGLSFVREKAAELLTEVSVGYPQSPINAEKDGGPAPKPGSRAPIREAEPPVGAGDAPRFAIFADPCDDSARIIADFPELVEAAVRPVFAPQGLWLVRPDGYVALSAHAGAWADVRRYLEALTRGANRPAEPRGAIPADR